MATLQEELKIKITTDASQLDAGITKATNKLNKFGKAGGESLGMSADAADQLHNSLADIRSISFTGMIAQITNLGTNFSAGKKELESLKATAGIANGTLKEFLERNKGIIANGRNFGAMSDDIADVWKEYDKLSAEAKDADEAVKNLNNSYTAFKSISWGVVAAIAAIAAELFIVIGSIRKALTLAPQIKQLYADSAKIGLSVQAYQQWGFVLESVGVEATELRGLIQTLSDEQAQMAEGSEGASKAFQALGLSFAEVTAMSQEQLFTETISRLQGVENSVERTKIAYQIFGEDAAHVANIMNMNNEQMRILINNYNELGGGASQELVNKSNVLSYSLSQLRQAWGGLTNALAEVFMPVITTVVNWLTKAIAIVRMFIQTIFGLNSTAASGSGSMSSGMSNYASTVDGATKAVKKLKREQMGFDELNKLPGKDSSGGSGAGDFGGGGGGLPGGGFTLPEVESLDLSKYREWFAKYKNLIQDITTWSLIGIGLTVALMCGLGGNLWGVAAGIGLAGMGIAIGSVEGGTFDRLVEKIKDTVNNVKDTLSTGWNKIKDWWGTNVAPKFTKEYWAQKLEPIRAGFQEKLEAVKTTISTKWQSVVDWWNKNVAPKFTKAYWAAKLENVRAAASEKLEAVKNAFSTAWTNIKNVFSGWGTFFTNLWDKVKTIFKSVGTTIGNSIAGAVKSVINKILTTVESKINSFITMINNAITVINKIPGVNITKLSKITVPKLATGGIVTSSTLANIGEAGAEAVLPLERNTQWMDTLADKIAARNGAPSKIVLMVDGKELGWASINGINNITKQTGNLQLQLI